MYISYGVQEGSTNVFQIEYYMKINGRKPVKEFLDQLNKGARAKAFILIDLLGEFGPLMRYPYSRHLQDGIFELRIQESGNSLRVLYFFFQGQRAVLTHGFVKKTQKTPPREIERARASRLEYQGRRLPNG